MTAVRVRYEVEQAVRTRKNRFGLHEEAVVNPEQLSVVVGIHAVHVH